ncbi:MarR family transcriptional regulator [Actinocorallia populi]|uniref:MarR family transcriptional regulator n=1 Tax=Actinocorallia populi TaxID=2079200 RepID=UPI0018E55B42|nr:MarR family transcriptional regulator [Actinocorallia populi]
MRRSPDGGKTFPRCKDEGRRRLEVALSTELPSQPATIPVGDVHAGTGRMVVLDVDMGRVPEQITDRRGHLVQVVDRVAVLLGRAGCRYILDRSPSGGFHLYIPFSLPRPFRELRELAEALSRRFPVIDPAPMYQPDSQIRPPGAAHKVRDGRLSGYLRLHGMSLAAAVDVARRPNGAAAWNALHEELEAELAAAARGGNVLVPSAGSWAPVDGRGYHWSPRPGGARPLPPRLEELARTGDHAAHGYATRHQARMALFGALFYRGWRFHEVEQSMAPGGCWPGLAVLWERKRGWRGKSAAEHLWQKIAGETRRGEAGPDSYTSGLVPTPPPSLPAETTDDPDNVKLLGDLPVRHPVAYGQLTQYQQIRQWHNAVRIAQQDPEMLAEWGGAAASILSLLKALGAAAQMSGATTIEFGARNLSLMTGVHYTTVASLLQTLASGPNAFVDLVRRGRREQADAYLLVIPKKYESEAAWRSWRAGRIEALHPVFLVLKVPASLVYDALGTTPLSPAELARVTGLGSSTVTRALTRLAEHGLAERAGPGLWRRGRCTLDEVAVEVDALTRRQELIDAHQADRAIWRSLIASWDATIEQAAQKAAAAQTAEPTEQPARRGRPLPPGAKRAPRHLSAPARIRPITQDELEQAKDAEIEEILAQAAIELQELVATDIAYARALAAADHTEALADEQLLAAERDDYETGLTEMRLQREQPDPLQPAPG